MNVYERLGRVLELYDKECLNHRSTLNLLRRLKAGELALEDIEVDESSWKIASKGSNGMPMEDVVEQLTTQLNRENLNQ